MIMLRRDDLEGVRAWSGTDPAVMSSSASRFGVRRGLRWWAGLAVGLLTAAAGLVLVLQNREPITLEFLWMDVETSVGFGLLLAAVAGVVLRWLGGRLRALGGRRS